MTMPSGVRYSLPPTLRVGTPTPFGRFMGYAMSVNLIMASQKSLAPLLSDTDIVKELRSLEIEISCFF